MYKYTKNKFIFFWKVLHQINIWHSVDITVVWYCHDGWPMLSHFVETKQDSSRGFYQMRITSTHIRNHSSLFQKLSEACAWPVEVNWRLFMNVSLPNIYFLMPSEKWNTNPGHFTDFILHTVSIIWCKCYSKHDGQLSQLCTVLCPWSSLFYWVLRLGRVPVLMFLQLIDVYFDCKSRNECWGKKCSFVLHVLSLFIFKAMYYFLRS